MSNLKKLASDTAIYGISSIGGRLLNYLLVPFYTDIFEPGQYGIVTELYAYVAFLNVLYLYGMETAFFRYAARNKEDEKVIYNSAFTSVLISSIAFSIILCLLATPIVDYLEYPNRERYVYWFAAILTIDAITAIPFAKLRLDGKPVRFMIAKLGNILLNIGINVFFLVLCRDIFRGEYLKNLRPLIDQIYNPSYDVEYVFLANLIANAALIVILWPTIRQAKLKIQKFYWESMIIYAYPLLIMGLAGATNEMLSRSMLKKILPEDFYPNKSNLAALGIFGACYKLSVFMNLAIQSFRYAAEPFFFSKAQDKNSREVFSQVMYYFIIVCSFIFFAITINLNWLGPLLLRDSEYWEGFPVVPVLLLGYLFLGIYMNLSIWFKLTDRTSYGTWFTGAGAFLTVILNLLLIPKLGYMGAAYTTLIVYFFMAAICYYYGQKYYPIPYNLKGGAAYIFGTTLLATIVMHIDIENNLIASIFHVVVTLAFLAFVFFYEKRKFSAKAA